MNKDLELKDFVYLCTVVIAGFVLGMYGGSIMQEAYVFLVIVYGMATYWFGSEVGADYATQKMEADSDAREES